VRGLRQRPKLRPRVIVRVRQLQLHTGEGRPSDDKRGAAAAGGAAAPGGGDTGGDVYFTFELGAEMLFPLTDPSAVLHIKVVNCASSSVQRPALLGQVSPYLPISPHTSPHLPTSHGPRCSASGS